MIGHDDCCSVLKRECNANTTAVVCAAKNPGQGIYQVSVVTIDDLAGNFKPVRTAHRLALAVILYRQGLVHTISDWHWMHRIDDTIPLTKVLDVFPLHPP